MGSMHVSARLASPWLRRLGTASRARVAVALLAGACGGQPLVSSGPAVTAAATGTPPAPPSLAPPTATAPVATIALPPARTFIVDTDVAADDLVALTFMLTSPNITVAGITVSGTGEARCEGGVAVVLGLLEYLDAPDLPVACGRNTPPAGSHAFPDAWRDAADRGSGLELPATDRVAVEGNAVELIKGLAGDHPGIAVLTLGPLTNLADALSSDPGLADRLGTVFIMGGALNVPGNLVGPDAPPGNSVAEWNVYVDPHAAELVVEAGLQRTFVSLDSTSQVPVTSEFAQRAITAASRPAGSVLAQLLTANPFMSGGSYYLWDPLAAEVAAGYELGPFAVASVKVEEAEGPESGRTRTVTGEPNCEYLATADARTAEDTLLAVLNAP